MKFKLDNITKDQMMVMMGCGLLVLFGVTIAQAYLIQQLSMLSSDMITNTAYYLGDSISTTSCADLYFLSDTINNEIKDGDIGKFTNAMNDRVSREIETRC